MLNKMLVIGHVGADPVMRHTPSGSTVTSFSLATNRVFTPPDGERVRETEWFRVVAWGSLAGTCIQYVNKGRKIYVEGRLRSRAWVGRDGQTRLANEIVASRVIFLDRRVGDEQRNIYDQEGEGRNNVVDVESLNPAIAESYYEDFELDEYDTFDFADVDMSVDYGYLEDYSNDDPNYEDFGEPRPTYRNLI